MERFIVAVIVLASVKVAEAQTTGACCFPDASCAVRDQILCEAQGGVFVRAGITCANVVCTGACCLPNGSCAVVTPQSCTASSGTFGRFGSLCANVVCGGACCHANGSCALSNEAACTAPSAFQGLGSTCGTVDCKGACCLRDGSCEETGEPECQSDNGVFQGLSAICAETDCAGACCLPNGTCVETSQPGCVQDQSGEFLGLTEACAGTVCIGACCFPNLPGKPCSEVGHGICVAANGQYQGRETTCSDDCPVAMPTAFTYQGQLKRRGVPLNGQIDARFTLWLSPTGDQAGDQIGTPYPVNAIEVVNGLFTVELDFGQDAFNGNARWLQIDLHDRRDPPGTFVTLSPRQQLTPTPYALQTRGIVVTDDGHVGIGTKTPSGPLTVHAVGTGFVHEGDTIQLATRLDSSGASIGTLSAHPLHLRTQNFDALTIDTSRRVGIGTTVPEVKLHVIGGSDATLSGGGFLQLGNSGGTNVAIDNDEIMARSGQAASTLFINKDGGDVKFGGAIDIGYEIVEVVDFSNNSIIAQCPTGKRVIGGGCACLLDQVQSSQPLGDTAWYCSCNGDNPQAFAICARVK
jgi:hypothetical protein